MRSTRNLVAALMLAVVPVLARCSDQGPTDVYDLIINNGTANTFDIWVSPPPAFASVGTVSAMSTITLRNLRHGDDYTFRLSAVGTGPGTFVYEMDVTSNGPDVTWTVP